MTHPPDNRLFKLDPSRSALLVIDLQNDFCHPNGAYAKGGHDVSPCMAAARQVATIIDEVRRVGVTVIFTKSINEDPPLHRLIPRRFLAELGSDDFEHGVGGRETFMPGEWGSDIVDYLTPKTTELVIEKGRYNAFFRTDLEEVLRDLNIDTLLFTGVTTNVCVGTTAQDAFIRGFDVAILSDCVGTFGNEWDLHQASLKTLDLLFGVVAASSDVLVALEP